MQTNKNEYTENKSIYQPNLFDFETDIDAETIEINEPAERFLFNANEVND